MSGAGERPESILEAKALLASANALVRELIEEGISEFPRLPTVEASAVIGDSTSGAGRSAGSSRIASSSLAVGGVIPVVPWADGAPPTLDEVQTHLGDCTRCDLCQGRRSIVFGDGNPDADLMFVGEGPGENEDRRGLPFVGRAGELLTQMIEKGLGLQRSDVYICNVVKCRPPGNRTPLADEIATCSRFLDGQITAVQPRVIVALGKPAASLLLGRNVSITKVRGTWHDYHGIPLMPTFHPAYVLRQYTVENRRRVWDDLKAALVRAQESSGTAQ